MIIYDWISGFYCGYGGEVALHGKSQEVTWAHTIEFFIRSLGEPAHMPDWNRLTHIVKPTIEEQKKFAQQIQAQSQQPQPQQRQQQQLSKI